MSGIATNLDRGESASQQARADVAAYLTRTGNADLVEILGLGDEPERPEPPGDCEICGNRLPSHGVCRRREKCREAARGRGENA